MQDGHRKPYKVVMRTPNGQTTYTTETYPDIDAMFAGSRARYVAVVWRNWYGGTLGKDSRDKREEALARLLRPYHHREP